MTRWVLSLGAALAFHALLAVALSALLGDERRPALPTPPTLALARIEFAQPDPPGRADRAQPHHAIDRFAVSPPMDRLGHVGAAGIRPLPKPPPFLTEPHVAPDETPVMDTPAEPPTTSHAAIDAPPAPRQTLRPDYPRGARRRGEEGTVILEITVSVAGHVASVRIATSSGFPDLDAAALKAVRSATFRPAEREGRAVEATVSLPIAFRLTAR